ncbi:MAG TPA: hypothetical protein VKV73_22875 [Chloroflexota bacterium]|nr:hypothetical protein [Chloroflexota bacterium]
MPTAPRQPLLHLLWDAWQAYAHRAAVYQTRALLNTAYFLVFGPCALVARMLGARLLDLDRRPRPSYWVQRKSTYGSLEDLERQF